jgi:uncharacterized protein (TIGR02145 family)
MKIKYSFNMLIIGLVLLIASSCRKENMIEPIIFNPSITYGSITDQDGNTYKTVTLGKQTWMAENLRTRKYRNGDAIRYIPDNAEWINLTSGAFSYFNNLSIYKNIYGCLYNAFAVTDSRNIAPSGWHVPTTVDWDTLMVYLGGSRCVNLKESGTIHWKPPIMHMAGRDVMIYDAIGTNETGFTALPGGQRDSDGNYLDDGLYGYWWTVTEFPGENGWYIGNYIYIAIPNNWPNMRSNYNFQKQIGISVRCLKD